MFKHTGQDHGFEKRTPIEITDFKGNCPRHFQSDSANAIISGSLSQGDDTTSSDRISKPATLSVHSSYVFTRKHAKISANAAPTSRRRPKPVRSLRTNKVISR